MEKIEPENTARMVVDACVVLSILWGWQIDRIRPVRYDLIGGLICLIGVCIIMYWPRGNALL